MCPNLMNFRGPDQPKLDTAKTRYNTALRLWSEAQLFASGAEDHFAASGSRMSPLRIAVSAGCAAP